MPSDQEIQSQNSQPVTRNPQGPIASNIKDGLRDGESILDFVHKNTPGYQDQGINEVIQQDVDAVGAERNGQVVTAPEPAPEVLPDLAEEDPVPEDNPVEDPAPEEGDPASEGEEGDDDGVTLTGNAAENFKKLRTKTKELEESVATKDKLLEEVTSELESFAKGEKLPDKVKHLEARVTELEPLEKVLKLKTSKYYQDSFVKPLHKIIGRLDKMAEDYNVDPAALKRAANLKNEAELNRFLSNNFDTVGATEIKGIVREYRGLQEGAREAEKQPEATLNAMIEDAETARRQHQVERIAAMQDTTRDAWRESLDYIKEEGKIQELIFREGDLEHNSKVYQPIVEAAASEYGKLVKILVKNGLEELPKDLALALSRQCLLAHASAVAIDSRERAVAHAEEIEHNSKRTQRYIRPSVTGRTDSRSTGRNGNQPRKTAEDRAQDILDLVKGR